MPFSEQIECKYGWIATWRLSEKPNELLQNLQLSENDEQRLSELHSDKRRIEFLAVRNLLQKQFGHCPQIEYNRFGKPLLKDSDKNLSISHSADFVGVFISEQKIGIDIEQSKRPIDRVASRFLHNDELEFIETLKDTQVAKIAYWSAKEAIFKCSDEQGIKFSKQIRIEGFEAKNGHRFKGKLILEDKTFYYELYFHFLENNVLVYAVEV